MLCPATSLMHPPAHEHADEKATQGVESLLRRPLNFSTEIWGSSLQDSQTTWSTTNSGCCDPAAGYCCYVFSFVLFPTRSSAYYIRQTYMSLLLFVDLTHNNISWYILLISVYRPQRWYRVLRVQPGRFNTAASLSMLHHQFG